MKKSTKRDKSASEAPAGCSSEAGSGARSRAEDLPTHTSPHGADVPEAKGRVPLDELKDYLETKAAKHETLRDSYAEASWSHHRDHNEKRAADFRLWLTALAELRGAPRPQSERSEDAPEAALAFKIRYFNEKAVEHDRAASKAQLEGLSRKHPKVVRHRTTAKMCQQLAADLETMLPEGVGAGASGLPNVKHETRDE